MNFLVSPSIYSIILSLFGFKKVLNAPLTKPAQTLYF